MCCCCCFCCGDPAEEYTYLHSMTRRRLTTAGTSVLRPRLILAKAKIKNENESTVEMEH